MTKEINIFFSNHILFEKDINTFHNCVDILKNGIRISSSDRYKVIKYVNNVCWIYAKNKEKYNVIDYFQEYNSGLIDVDHAKGFDVYTSDIINNAVIGLHDIISLIEILNKDKNETLYIVYEDNYERELIRSNIEPIMTRQLNIIHKDELKDIINNKDDMIECYCSTPEVLSEIFEIRKRLKTRYFLSTIYLSEVNKKYIEDKSIIIDGFIKPYKD